ncbi:MAG: MerR family transcriptional regulator [Candidatus Omnitrophota bacterium]
MRNSLITTYQLSKLLGVSVASVNYYTNLGLFKVKDRKGNARLYDREEINNTYKTIQRLRKEGYSLMLIKQRLDKGYSI